MSSSHELKAGYSARSKNVGHYVLRKRIVRGRAVGKKKIAPQLVLKSNTVCYFLTEKQRNSALRAQHWNFKDCRLPAEQEFFRNV